VPSFAAVVVGVAFRPAEAVAFGVQAKVNALVSHPGAPPPVASPRSTLMPSYSAGTHNRRPPVRGSSRLFVQHVHPWAAPLMHSRRDEIAIRRQSVCCGPLAFGVSPAMLRRVSSWAGRREVGASPRFLPPPSHAGPGCPSAHGGVDPVAFPVPFSCTDRDAHPGLASAGASPALLTEE